MPDGAGGFRQGFSGPALLRIHASHFAIRLRDCHPLRCRFPTVFIFGSVQSCMSYNPDDAETSSVWALPLSLATTQGISFDFSSCRYLDVSVPCVCLPFGIPGRPGGLPHSDIRASSAVCAYTRLFAAYHVLHRLWVPRHPPCTLIYFLSPKNVSSRLLRFLSFLVLSNNDRD